MEDSHSDIFEKAWQHSDTDGAGPGVVITMASTSSTTARGRELLLRLPPRPVGLVTGDAHFGCGQTRQQKSIA
eukprot:10111274-Heterocapsa_arctica.AAC.1